MLLSRLPLMSSSSAVGIGLLWDFLSIQWHIWYRHKLLLKSKNSNFHHWFSGPRIFKTEAIPTHDVDRKTCFVRNKTRICLPNNGFVELAPVLCITSLMVEYFSAQCGFHCGGNGKGRNALQWTDGRDTKTFVNQTAT